MDMPRWGTINHESPNFQKNPDALKAGPWYTWTEIPL